MTDKFQYNCEVTPTHPQTFQGVFHRQAPEIIDQPFRVEQVGMDNGSFDVIKVGEMFQGPLQEPGLLAKLGHMGPVIVSEHLVA